MRTEYVFLPKSARENEFRGNRKCTGLALSFYRDISIIHDCSRPPERGARIPVIKQRGEHVDVDVGAANVKIEICRIVRRSLILARVLSLIYPVIRSSSRLIGSLV